MDKGSELLGSFTPFSTFLITEPVVVVLAGDLLTDWLFFFVVI